MSDSTFEVIIPSFLDADGQKLTPLTEIAPTPEELQLEPTRSDSQPQTQNLAGDARPTTPQAVPLRAVPSTLPTPPTPAASQSPTSEVARELTVADFERALPTFPEYLARVRLAAGTAGTYCSIAKQLVKAAVAAESLAAMADRILVYGLHTQGLAKAAQKHLELHTREACGLPQLHPVRPQGSDVGGRVIQLKHPLARDWGLFVNCFLDTPQRPMTKRPRYDVLDLRWDARVLAGNLLDGELNDYIDLSQGRRPGAGLGEYERVPVLREFLAAVRRIFWAAWSGEQSAPRDAPVFVLDRASRLERADWAQVRSAWTTELFVPSDIVTVPDLFHIGWRRDVHPKLLAEALWEKGRAGREKAAARERDARRREELDRDIAATVERRKDHQTTLDRTKAGGADMPADVLAEMAAQVQREDDHLAQLRAELRTLTDMRR